MRIEIYRYILQTMAVWPAKFPYDDSKLSLKLFNADRTVSQLIFMYFLASKAVQHF